MTAPILPHIPKGGFWYLLSPYTRHPRGMGRAYAEALIALAYLTEFRHHVYSPIVHSHDLSFAMPVSMREDHGFWIALQTPFMAKADGALLLQLDGWEASKGVAEEIDYFTLRGVPFASLRPDDIPDFETRVHTIP